MTPRRREILSVNATISLAFCLKAFYGLYIAREGTAQKDIIMLLNKGGRDRSLKLCGRWYLGDSIAKKREYHRQGN